MAEPGLPFRKRPVVIRAIQWTGEAQNVFDVMRFAESGPAPLMGGQFEVNLVPKTVEIETSEGRMIASVGDWIIRGIAGEFYPCKPAIFEQTYEAVDG